METRTLGRTGLEVSIIGFGGIPIRRPPHDEAVELYRRGMDMGINYFDAARIYTRCEERLAEAIRGRRDEVIIATKDLTHDCREMAEAIDTSLRTLGTDYIDLYQCHELHQMKDLEECLAPGGAMEALQEARQAGKIGFIGMTGHNPDVIMAGLDTGLMDAVLILLNYVNRRMLDEVLPRCQRENIGVALLKPLGGCLLAAHADLALRWVLQQEGVHTVPVGMWRPFELESNVKVGEQSRPLTDQELSVLDEQRQALAPTFCRLCYRHYECPHGVESCRIMIMDLLYMRHGIDEWFEREWDRELEAVAKCGDCADRDRCASSCPFGLNVPETLERMHATYMPIIEAYRAQHA